MPVSRSVHGLTESEVLAIAECPCRCECTRCGWGEHCDEPSAGCWWNRIRHPKLSSFLNPTAPK